MTHKIINTTDFRNKMAKNLDEALTGTKIMLTRNERPLFMVTRLTQNEIEEIEKEIKKKK